MPFDPHRWKQTIRSLILLTFALLLLVALEVFSRFFLEGSASDGARQMVSVNIPEGANLEKISELLYRSGIVEHPLLFRYAARIMGADTKIQAGEMQLATGQSLVDLIRSLIQAKGVGIRVTFREGLTSMDIAGILQKEVGLDSAAFMDVVNDTTFVRELGIEEAPSLEGYLFPDTYLFATGIEPRRIASRMVANFRMHLPQRAEERALEHDLTLNQAITLASIIEWEAFKSQEAKLISSVYHNRLKRNMLLQADPTVSYALGMGPSRLYYRQLKVDSPYNTYMYEGLPPGAINNPGVSSIEAALSPAKTNYLYFVAQGNGTHAFSANLAEHLIAKQTLDSLRHEAVVPNTTSHN
jgi:UPF0755 protein